MVSACQHGEKFPVAVVTALGSCSLIKGKSQAGRQTGEIVTQEPLVTAQLNVCWKWMCHTRRTGSLSASYDSSKYNNYVTLPRICSLVEWTSRRLREGRATGRSVSLRAQSQGHHTIDRLKERGVDRGSASRSSLIGRRARGPSSIRRTLEPFQRQRWGNSW